MSVSLVSSGINLQVDLEIENGLYKNNCMHGEASCVFTGLVGVTVTALIFGAVAVASQMRKKSAKSSTCIYNHLFCFIVPLFSKQF